MQKCFPPRDLGFRSIIEELEKKKVVKPRKQWQTDLVQRHSQEGASSSAGGNTWQSDWNQPPWQSSWDSSSSSWQGGWKSSWKKW